MPAVAGRRAQVKKPSTAVTLTDEATTHAGDGKNYQITDATKRVLSPTAAITVKVGGVATGESYTLNRLTGTVTFVTANVGRAAVTLSGSYLPLSVVAEARTYTYELTAKNDPDSAFGDDYVTRVPTKLDVRGSLGRWSIDSFFSDALLADTPLVFQFFANAAQSPELICWARLSSRGIQAVQDGLGEETLDFLGTLDADNRAADLGVVLVSTPTLVLRHTFTGADDAASPGNADTGQSPTVLGGSTWGRQSNQCYMVADGASNKNGVVYDAGISDGTANLTIPVKQNGGRFLFRATTTDNGFFIDTEASNYRLYRLQAGAFNDLGASTGVTPANGDVLSIALLGSSITLLVNGVVRLGPVTDSFNQTATKYGPGATNSPGVFRADLLEVYTT